MSARTTIVRPLQMAPNTIEHFYAGGSRIAELRGLRAGVRPPAGGVARGDGVACRRARRRTCTDRRRRPVRRRRRGRPARLGRRARPRHRGAGQAARRRAAAARARAPRPRASRAAHLGCGYGKTEAWYVLDADEGATVHLGWTEDVDPDELAERRDRQDSEWMLERLHRVPVRAGDGILVPAGQPHAIGAGVFVVEAQEPTDFSIVLEWSVTTASREESHLDLGFETAMGAVSHRALAPEALDALCRHVPVEARSDSTLRCLPEQADPFFRLDVLVAATGRPWRGSRPATPSWSCCPVPASSCPRTAPTAPRPRRRVRRAGRTRRLAAVRETRGPSWPPGHRARRPGRRTMSATVGLDVGSTYVKGVLSTDGIELASARRPTPWQSLPQGRSEITGERHSSPRSRRCSPSSAPTAPPSSESASRGWPRPVPCSTPTTRSPARSWPGSTPGAPRTWPTCRLTSARSSPGAPDCR